MKLLLIIIIIILLFIMLVLYMPIFVELKFCKQDKRVDVTIGILPLYGIPKIKINIPVIKIVDYNKKFAVKTKSKVEIFKTEKDVLLEKNVITYEKIIKFYRNILQNKRKLIELNKYLMKKIEIEKLVLISNIGFSDVLLTAIFSGFLLQIKSMLVHFFIKVNKIENIKFIVNPVFQTETLDILLDCIIKVKFVHIIIAGIKGLKLVKGGESNVRTSY